MLTIQLLKPGRDTMDLLNDRNLQSRHQNWRQTPNLVPWEKSRCCWKCLVGVLVWFVVMCVCMDHPPPPTPIAKKSVCVCMCGDGPTNRLRKKNEKTPLPKHVCIDS